MKFPGILAALILLVGCTNSSTDLLTDSRSFDGEISTDLSAASAYRNLRDASRLCLEHSPMGTPVTVESEFDSEIREGRITQRMIAQGVRLNLSIIDITTASGKSPLIRLYTLKGLSAVGTKRPTLEAVKRWAAGDKAC
ncbi:hypothetical protein [Pseudomonas syringae group genomosp. 3]|uniref:hypothetical protein n=1 Tax=Pseudomonas syringae group genomosp. 3 TaxID=251701 RepID=UPI001187716F|nr:hypothetical protein [Pseudomonas syringae group genomosp. 3]